MKPLYFFIAALLLSLQGLAQTAHDVHGTVTDSTKVTLPGSTVKIVTATDSTTTTTNAQGAFLFHNIKGASFSLTIQSIGYEPIKRRFLLDNTNNPVFLKPIVLKTSTTMLGLVTISDVLPVKIKEDTVEFNTAAYKVRDGAPIEDVIKKIPGADVDANGNITFQGKSVTKVRVNGKDFFGGDLKTATQNLPADAVQNVQMVNDYGDQANLTGIKTGEPDVVLNINIKPSRNHGYFGQASAGDGRDAIPQVDGAKDQNRYVAQANLFNFDGNRQIAVLGNLNNTNTNLFNFGGPGGQGGRGGGPPPPGGNVTNGITTARSIGFNYRDSWGKKITVYGSYSYSDNTVNTISSTIQNNISLVNPSTNTQTSNETDVKKNHRFTFNMEYKPDTVNYLKISPSFAYAGVNTVQTGANNLVNDTATISNYSFKSIVRSSAPTYGVNVLYNHRFNAHGRNFSIAVGAGHTVSNQFQNPVYDFMAGTANTPLDQFIYTDSKTDTLGTSLSYIEPIGGHSYVEFNYNYKRSHTSDDKTTDTLTVNGILNQYDLLSNDYNFTFTTNRFGVNYRYVQKKYNYVLGVVAQPSTLEGFSPTLGIATKVNEFNFSPNAHFIYNFSRNQSLSANYTGSSNQPTYSELQPVTDFSNASYPITGNPDLKPEYNNTFSLRYNKFNFESGNVFFSNLNFTQTDNKIVSNTITYPTNYTANAKLAGTVATEYLNAPGYYSASAFYVFAKPWEKRKYNLFFIGNASYNNNISYITNVDPATFDFTTEKNVAKTLVLSQGIRFRVDIADIIDAEANTTYAINSSKNSISQPGINDNFRSWILGVNGKNYVWKDWTYSYDYSKTLYYGYKGSTNPNIFNTYVERRFLKGNMATVRLSAMDLFNQNTGFTSTQTGNYITQTNVNRLGRYYLLTFTYRFQKMAGKSPNMGPGGPGGPRFGPPPGGGPGGGGPPGGGGGD
jgi:hypothetical protein